MSDTVATRTVVVTDPAGVHVRTGRCHRRGRAPRPVAGDDRSRTDSGCEATDVLQIMTLVAEQGDELTIEAVGPDAAAVLDAIEPLFAGQFGDDNEDNPTLDR